MNVFLILLHMYRLTTRSGWLTFWNAFLTYNNAQIECVRGNPSSKSTISVDCADRWKKKLVLWQLHSLQILRSVNHFSLSTCSFLMTCWFRRRCWPIWFASNFSWELSKTATIGKWFLGWTANWRECAENTWGITSPSWNSSRFKCSAGWEHHYWKGHRSSTSKVNYAFCS